MFNLERRLWLADLPLEAADDGGGNRSREADESWRVKRARVILIHAQEGNDRVQETRTIRLRLYAGEIVDLVDERGLTTPGGCGPVVFGSRVVSKRHATQEDGPCYHR